MGIYWDLFFVFFKIGLFSFGGGLAMVSVIQQEVLAHGWIPAAEYARIITISQMTPGPIAVNTATYVGARVCGPDFVPAFMGSFIATLGVSLPSFIAFMITAVIFFLNITVFPIDNATSESNTFNPIGIPVLAVLFYLHYYRKVGAIRLMLISGIIGVLVY